MVSLRYVERYIDSFKYAADTYLDPYDGNIANVRHVRNFVNNAHELVEAFKAGKSIVDCSSNMTTVQTVYLTEPLGDLTIKYQQIFISLNTNRDKIIKKGTLCKTTRNQLTDINAHGHALIESIYSKASPGALRHIKDLAEIFKRYLDDAQRSFGKNNCEKNCNEAEETCSESCKDNCEESCKSCTGYCYYCQDFCVEDCQC
jgi:hypothetical protein